MNIFELEQLSNVFKKVVYPNNIKKDGKIICPICGGGENVYKSNHSNMNSCLDCGTYIHVKSEEILTIFYDIVLIRKMKMHQLDVRIKQKQNNIDLVV